MNKKLIASLCMTTLLVGTTLVGCSSGEVGQQEVIKETKTETKEQTKAKEEQIDLQLTFWGSTSDEEVYKQRAEQMKEVFPNINLELVYIPSEYAQKVQTMIAGGTAPDILQLAEEVHAFSSKGQLLALNEYVDGVGIDLNERFGTAYSQYMKDNTLYAMPDRGGAMIVYYNKDMFDVAGVEYPTKDWTWDDLLEATQKLTIKEGDEVVQYGFAAGSWWPWWMSFMYQNGGRVLDDNGEVVFNSPENVEALQFYNDLVYKYGVAPSLVDFANMGNIGPDTLFAQGKLAINITGFWNISSLNNVPDLNWDIAPIWQNKERATTAFGSALAISKDCKYPDEAFKVIEYLTNTDSQKLIVENKQDAPSNMSVLESETFLSADYAKSPIDMSTFAQSADAIMEIPLGPWWNEMTKTCEDYLNPFFLNKIDAQTAVEQVQQELEMMMKNYK